MTEKSIDFEIVTDEYEKNKQKKWSEWLEYSSSFGKTGKQGLVGILKIKDSDEKCVYKMSQYINYLVRHENKVMIGLNEISKYCPHFCQGIGTLSADVGVEIRKGQNPFVNNGRYSIQKDFLLCENIDESKKLFSFIKDKSVDEKVIFSAVKQVMMALAIAQNKKKFTHYDLHSCNIMMKKCDPDTVFLYVLDEENQFCVPTYGFYPVIIDFGFSYIDDFEGDYAWASFGFTDIGFTSDRFDGISDQKLFLVTLSSEMRERRKTENVKIFRNIVKNIFYPLRIDWESGWNDISTTSASNKVLDVLEPFNTTSNLFKHEGHHLMDILQALIILPLKQRNHDNIGTIFKAFLKEWTKIEDEFKDTTVAIYMFKMLVDSARSVKDKYSDTKQRKQAIDEFKHKIYDSILRVTKFCTPKEIKYEVMLCSLLVLSKNIEGILYEIMQKYSKDRQKEYAKLPAKSVEQMYAAIEANIQSEYEFTDKTSVVVFDANTRSTNTFKLKQEHLDIINIVDPIYRGTVLCDIYNGKEPDVVIDEEDLTEQ